MNESPLTRCAQFCSAWLGHARRGETRTPWIVIRLLRTLAASVRGFESRKGPLHASALTFYTLLSLVPVAAMAFGVAKGFGFEQLLEKELLRHFAAQEDVVRQIIAFARNMLDNTRGGLVAGVGVAVLFWSVIKVLGRIEDNFNNIWNVPSRSLARKLSDYLTIMTIGPVLLIMSGSATVFIATQVTALSSHAGLERLVSPAVSFGLALAPYVLAWLLFALIYLIMPNTRVCPGSALLAAVLAGTAFQLTQALYVKFQIGVTSYNAIYGSFAALPLFLVWLQLSWLIVLFGAEIAFAFPNSNMADRETGCRSRSVAQSRLLALAMCHESVRRFHRGEQGITEERLAAGLDITPREARDTADILVHGNLLLRAAADDETLLLPARDIATITIQDVMDVMDNADENPLFPASNPRLSALCSRLAGMRDEADRSPYAVLLKDVDLDGGSLPDT